MANNVLCVLRVSTDRQQLDDQRTEMIEFCKQNGYDDDHIITIEGIGASAIKLNDKYKDMIERIKNHVEKHDVDCVAVWHINRLGRNDDVLINLKNFFVKNKVQFICKNPSLRLLNSDGTVNAGSELAYSLFATMCKQDMEEKQAKFKRAKTFNREKGKYSGGNNLKIGYRVDESGFLVPDEHDKELIRQILELYATGQYSNRTLYKEIQARGWKRGNGEPMSYVTTSRALRDTAYIGYTIDPQGRKRNYIPIITQDLWNRVEKVRNGNYRDRRKGRLWTFATKIMKCGECGMNMSARGGLYSCYHHTAFIKTVECNNKINLPVDQIDGLLWDLASKMHMEYLTSLSDETIENYRNQLAVIQGKIDTVQERIDNIQNKKKKVIDTYLEEYITKEERDKRLVKIDKDAEEFLNTRNGYQEDYLTVERLIKVAMDDKENLDTMTDIMLDILNETDAEKMYNIVHQHILRLVPTEMIMGAEEDHTKNKIHQRIARKLHITYTNGQEIDFCYVPRKYQGHKFFCWSVGQNKWLPYEVQPIIRDKFNDNKVSVAKLDVRTGEQRLLDDIKKEQK